MAPNDISFGANSHREIISKSYQINPISDCIYHALIDMDLNGRPFGSKSIGNS